MTGLVRVILPYACFALVVDERHVIDAPPIARWTIGKPVSEIIAYYCFVKKAEIEWLKHV